MNECQGNTYFKKSAPHYSRGPMRLLALLSLSVAAQAQCPTDKCMADSCVDNSEDYKCAECKQGWLLTEALKRCVVCRDSDRWLEKTRCGVRR